MKVFEENRFGLAVLALGLVLLISFYAWAISPRIKTRKVLQANLVRLEGEAGKNRSMLQGIKLPDAGEKKQWEAVKAKMANPPGPGDFPQLMQELSRQAVNCNIADASLAVVRSPSSLKAPHVQAADFAVKITFHCQYRDLALFLRELDHLSQQVMVESLEVRKSSPLITTELQVRPFALVLKK